MNSIETLVLQWIGENTSSPDVFVDTPAGMAQIRDSVNHAVQEICALTKGYVKTYFLPLVSGRQFYRLSPQRGYWAYPLEVFDRANHRKLTQTSIQKLVVEDPRFLTRTGTSPTEYYLLGFSALGIFPQPTATGSVLEIRAAMVPQAYERGEEHVHLRDSYQRAAAWYAISEFYASRGDASRAQEAWKHYVEVAGLAFLQPSTADRLFRMGLAEQRGWVRG